MQINANMCREYNETRLSEAFQELGMNTIRGKYTEEDAMKENLFVTDFEIAL